MKKLLLLVFTFPLLLCLAFVKGGTFNNSVKTGKRVPPCSLTVVIGMVQNVICNGTNTGSATAAPFSGTSPYTYLWIPGGNTNATATGLTAGTYTVTVIDANSCTATSSIMIYEPPPFVYALNFDTASNLCNGSIWVTLSGGTPPYTYAWGMGSTTDSVAFLCAGTYCFKLWDANGCTTATDSLCVAIPTLTSSFVNEVKTTSQNIAVFPNPTSGVFTFQLSVVSPEYSGSVEVYNVLGEKIYSQFNIHNSQLTVNLSSQPKGLYLYRVIKSDGSLIGEGKIVIQK